MADLIQYLRQEPANAFKQLVERFAQKLWGIARQYVHDRHIAEDVVQNVFLEFYRGEKYRGINTEGQLEAFLVRMTIRRAQDAWRRMKRNLATSVEHLADFTADKPASEQTVDIESALLQLRPEYRLILHLKYVEDLSIAEIARVLDGAPENTVKSHLHRARNELRKILQGSFDEGSDLPASSAT